jgi:GDPmannose 4,6-dehydratase
MKNVALITGITGQDGSYLSVLLLQKGYTVHGTSRTAVNSNIVAHQTLGISGQVTLHQVNWEDLVAVTNLINHVNPTEIYHLAAQSSVLTSQTDPYTTLRYTTLSTLHILETIRTQAPSIRFFHASSCEIFDPAAAQPLSITSPIKPSNPYGTAKLMAHNLVLSYRSNFGIFGVNGILFPHESPLRAPQSFLKATIQRAVKIAHGKKETIRLGQIENERDFGSATDYVVAMWLSLQMPVSADYIIASGQAVSIKTIVEYVLHSLRLPLNAYVIDEALWRIPNAPIIYGDITETTRMLEWQPEQTIYATIDTMIEFEKEQQHET